MDKKETIKHIIQSSLSIPNGKLHYYPNISKKIQDKVIKRFDANLDFDDVICFYDSALVNNGTVFTTMGAYYLSLFEKPFYFNYEDISEIIIIPDKKGKYSGLEAQMNIRFTNGKNLYIGSSDFYKENIRNLLFTLKNEFSKWDSTICIKTTGRFGKYDLSEEIKSKCNLIIHTASVAAGAVGTGLAQLPLADNAILTPIQITMICTLGQVFGIRVTEGVAKGIIAGSAAAFFGRGATQVLLGWIPGLGNAINTATAAGITEAIGWIAASHFYDLQQKEKAKYKVDGLKEGYAKASNEYEHKLKKQAEEFIKSNMIQVDNFEEYEKLIFQYEQYIIHLEFEKSNNSKELDDLKNAKFYYKSLLELQNNMNLNGDGESYEP